MSLTGLEADLAIHQKLPDEPNDVGGLSAQALKEKFDEAGLTIQAYLNETHIPEVEEALEKTLDEARGYADRKVVAVGAGDMAAALYDTRKRRQDVYQYAHDEAVRVLGPAARFGYVAVGAAQGTSRNGADDCARFAGSWVDPRGFWDAGQEEFAVPEGAQAMAVTLYVKWARQVFNDCTVRAVVNGATAASVSGPDDSSGNYRWDTVTLAFPVQGGDRVAVRLETQARGGIVDNDQAEVNAQTMRAEILM